MKKLFAAALFLLPVAAHADDVKKLSGADLAVQTHKWDGKTIETSGFCFYADVNEYRCMVPGAGGVGARVDFMTMEPDAARQKIEDHCDTISKMLTKACAVRFQFVYESYDTHVSGADVFHIVIAKDNAGTILGK
jgi:hypothetical protein